jgi:aspartate/tyrosine/aromatic aminotransferase
MVDYLSKKPKLSFVDDPREVYERILFANQESKFVQQDRYIVQFPMEMIAEALEHFNEYMRVEFLEWRIGLLKRRMGKMEIEREALYLKAVEARSTCEECEEYGHVQGKPLFNASLSKIWFLFVHN